MFRANLIVIGATFVLSLSSAASEEGETAVSVASATVELNVPKGFTLEGTKLTLPHGQTLDKVTGLQECGKLVLIVRQREVGVYNLRQKQYSVLLRPANLGADSELILIPFNAAVSSDLKVGERTAFVAVKQPDSLLTGVYRYRVGESGLQNLAIFGGSIIENKGQFKSWRTQKRENGSTGIGIDVTGHPSVKYYCITHLQGREMLQGVVLRASDAALIKLKEEQEQRSATKPPADSTPTLGSPED